MHLPSVHYLSRGLDAVLYVFSPVVALYLLRICQRRQILARLGRRTLVICDMPYVHQACPAVPSCLLSASVLGCGSLSSSCCFQFNNAFHASSSCFEFKDTSDSSMRRRFLRPMSASCLLSATEWLLLRYATFSGQEQLLVQHESVHLLSDLWLERARVHPTTIT